MQVKNDSLSCLFKYFQVYQNYLWFGLEWRDFDWMVAADGQAVIKSAFDGLCLAWTHTTALIQELLL